MEMGSGAKITKQLIPELFIPPNGIDKLISKEKPDINCSKISLHNFLAVIIELYRFPHCSGNAINLAEEAVLFLGNPGDKEKFQVPF